MWGAIRHYKYSLLKSPRCRDIISWQWTGSKLKKDLDLELEKKKKERSACMHVCIHVYIYDPVKTKPKNSVSFLCSALQRKEMWLHFPLASLKAQYKPNISVSHTCQSTASLLGSLFSLAGCAEGDSPLLLWAGGGCYPKDRCSFSLFLKWACTLGELFCSLSCLAIEIAPLGLKPESIYLYWLDTEEEILRQRQDL